MSHYETIELLRGPAVPILSKALRAMFFAQTGKKLVGADFANIESRVNAWLAGEQQELDAFRAYDEGRGPDLYLLAYSTAFGVPVKDVTKAQRQVGKVQCLSCGYQGSVGAYMNMAANYFIKPDDIVRTVKPQTYGQDAWRLATEQYDKATNRYGLSADQWVCLKIVVNGWRAAHPAIVQSWWDRQDGVVEAVGSPGTRVDILNGKINYLMHEGFLWARTPSGKLMAYARPRLVETREDYIVDADGNIWPMEEMTPEELGAAFANDNVQFVKGKTRTQVAFDGRNQRTGAWGTQRMYGGLLDNNDTQLTARELLCFAMENVEAAGYPVVLHVHDELVAEVDQAFGSANEFGEIMKILPPWIKGLPMAVSAWEDQRFG